MKSRRVWKAIGIAGASGALVLIVASPAAAHTSIGDKPNFFLECDASVYITNELVGSPGKIEAWGGFVCPSNLKWAGDLRLQILRNNAVVRNEQKHAPQSSSDHIDATYDNTVGTQNWQAKLWLNRPGFDSTLITTGVIPA